MAYLLNRVNRVIRMLKAPESMEYGEQLKALEKFNLSKRKMIIINTYIALTEDFPYLSSLNCHTAL